MSGLPQWHRLAAGWAVILELCSATALWSAQQRVFFSPGLTDTNIAAFTNNHYAVVDPAVTARGRLVLFLPGTGATPALYRYFPQNAASLGFHALGLMYPNGEAINQLCAQYAPLDPEAAGSARLEVIDGADRAGFLSVDRSNSIENRLLKALQYLQANYPTRGWGQFYSGTNLLWTNVMVCGHSQGAGMAAMLAKTRRVDRCVMLADMDWWVAGNRPYNWMSLAPQTPVDRWFLLAHRRDQFLDFAEMQVTALTLDLTRYGPFIQVETSVSPVYWNRHFLSTDLEPAPAQGASYHGCLVVDAATPLQPDGVTPVLKPVWDYLLLHETKPITIEATGTNLLITFSPGILQRSATLTNWVSDPTAQSPLALPLDPLGPPGFFHLAVP
jgi:pimeloyl-ACP methyl ester carboxylesterase